MLLHAVILNDVRMAQVLQQVHFILDLRQLFLSLDPIRFLRQLDAFDGQETTCSEVESRVNFAERARADQIVLLVVHEYFVSARGRVIHEHVDWLWLRTEN